MITGAIIFSNKREKKLYLRDKIMKKKNAAKINIFKFKIHPYIQYFQHYSLYICACYIIDNDQKDIMRYLSLSLYIYTHKYIKTKLFITLNVIL